MNKRDMADVIDERALLLALQSMARTLLAAERPACALTLACMPPEEFASSPWAELGIGGTGAALLLENMQRMFPARGLPIVPVPDMPGRMAAAVYRRWSAGDKDVVYQSSGSSGAPKYLSHPYEALQQEVTCLASLLDGIEGVLALTPQHHCFGFTFGVMLHTLLQVPYSAMPPLPTLVAHALYEKCLVVGYPDFWIQMRKNRATPPPGTVCLSAGSPWSDAEITAMLAGEGVHILEIYGSSENGAIGFRRGAHTFTLLDYWSRAEVPSGTDMVLQRVLPSGKTMLRPLQDTLEWHDSRRFRVAGRLDQAVQVSGINVYPAQIAQQLEEVAHVAQCRVRLMRPDEGRRLKAFIVPEPGTPLATLTRELKTFCKTRFSPPERPVKFSFGPQLPANDFGKDTDWE